MPISAITSEPLEHASNGSSTLIISRHHPMVERADKFENGYCGVRRWCLDVGDGRQGARAPSHKIGEKYFSGNYYEKSGHFRAKIM